MIFNRWIAVILLFLVLSVTSTSATQVTLVANSTNNTARYGTLESDGTALTQVVPSDIKTSTTASGAELTALSSQDGLTSVVTATGSAGDDEYVMSNMTLSGVQSVNWILIKSQMRTQNGARDALRFGAFNYTTNLWIAVNSSGATSTMTNLSYNISGVAEKTAYISLVNDVLNISILSWGVGGSSDVLDVSYFSAVINYVPITYMPPTPILNITQSDFGNNADTFTDFGNPNTNYGTLTNFYAGGSGLRGMINQTLIIPPNSIIISAINNWYMDAVGTRVVDIFDILELWEELSVTWNNQPHVGEMPSSSKCPITGVGWTTCDVTKMVQNWTVGFPNYGQYLINYSEVATFIWSKEYGGNNPYLRIQYSGTRVGQFWVNFSVLNGTGNFTDSMNKSWNNNASWLNDTSSFLNVSTSAHGTVEGCFYSYNVTGGGTLNQTPLCQNITLLNNPILLSGISTTYNVATGSQIKVDANYTDADGDTGVFDRDFSQGTFDTTTGIWIWNTTTGDIGSYTFKINVTDGYGAISTKYFTVNVGNYCGNLNVDGQHVNVTGDLDANSTCFTVLAHNVTIEGNYHVVNFSKVSAGSWISNSGGFDNLTVSNFTVKQTTSSSNNAFTATGMSNGTLRNINISTVAAIGVSGISISGGSLGVVLENLTIKVSSNIGGTAITLSGSSNITVKNSSLQVTGASTASSLYLTGSTDSNFINDTVVSASGRGIELSASSNSNNFSSINSTGVTGIYISSSSNNNFTNSTFSGSLQDYWLTIANETNRFLNTNFTVARKIRYGDSTDHFMFSINGLIWLNTNLSKADTINRTLFGISNLLVTLNETNSTSGVTAYYNITGLDANTLYNIYNTTTSDGIQNPYNLTSDADGNINFSIFLKNETQIEISKYIVPDTSFTISLPSGYTYLIFNAPNASVKYLYPDGQNATQPFFNVTNTGSVIQDFRFYLNSTISSILTYADLNNDHSGGKIEVNESNTTVVIPSLGIGISQGVWIFVNLSQPAPQNTNKTLTINSSS